MEYLLGNQQLDFSQKKAIFSEASIYSVLVEIHEIDPECC